MVCREVWITAVRPLVMGCTVVSFSLALAKGDTADSFTLWTWCVFTWCFCTFVTFLVFFLDLCPSVSTKLPFQDFQTVFATFASLMVGTIFIYPYVIYFFLNYADDTSFKCALTCTGRQIQFNSFNQHSAERITRL